MRKVITGEQVAQIHGRRPFDLPVWRAPVYQTPAIVTLAAWLYRLIAWLVRMVARHPRAAVVVAVLAVIWLDLAGSGLARAGRAGCRSCGGAGGLAVVLPGLVRPVDHRASSRGVAGLVVPPPVGRGPDRCRGCTVVPGPGRAAGAGQGHRHRYTDRVQVKLVSGQSAADLAGCADNLAHGFGALTCRVRSARSGRVVLEFVRRDALAALVPAQPHPRPPGPEGAAGRQEGGREGGRPALADPAARHPRPGRRGHRRREGVAAVGAGPGPVPAPPGGPGPGAGG